MEFSGYEIVTPEKSYKITLRLLVSYGKDENVRKKKRIIFFTTQ